MIATTRKVNLSELLCCAFLVLVVGPYYSLGFTIPRTTSVLCKRAAGSSSPSPSSSQVAAGARQQGADMLAAPQQETRKKKKNKYAKFSKADKVAQDPFQALVKESEEKLNQINNDKDQARDKPSTTRTGTATATATSTSQEETKPLQYPNNKDIDPYDPTTFGYIEIGTIHAPHGVHGWVKVQGCTDFPERLTTAGMPLHMKQVNKRAPRKVTLEAGKLIGGDEAFLIQLEGMHNRTSAQKLKGAILYYATQQDTLIEQQDAGVFLVSDMVGLQVRLSESAGGHLVGTVDGIVLAEEMCSIPGLGQDMLEVALVPHKDKPMGAPKDLVLIPYVPQIVPKVDIKEREIIIDPPAGLLDLTYIREKKVRIKALLAPAKD
jgi:16S rRNA processing protein RimM